MRFKLLLFFSLFATFQVVAQTHRNEIGFQTDNDSFLAQRSDRYYTNGIFFFYRHALKVKPTDSTGLQNKILGFEFGQKIWNAQTGNIRAPYFVDRPFAAYLYAGSSLNLLYRNESSLKLNAQIGILGPGALGYEVQGAIHSLLGFYTPHGWEYQIHDGLELNLSANYTKLLFRKNWIDLSATGYGDLGTGFTGAGIGPLLRLGAFNQLFNSVSTQSTTIIEHTIKPLHKHEFFVYYKPQINYVGYDASIQGGLFTSAGDYPQEILQSKITWVFSNQIGAALTTNRFVFDLSVVVHNRNVKQMYRATHQWGSVTALYRFK